MTDLILILIKEGPVLIEATGSISLDFYSSFYLLQSLYNTFVASLLRSDESIMLRLLEALVIYLPCTEYCQLIVRYCVASVLNPPDHCPITVRDTLNAGETHALVKILFIE